VQHFDSVSAAACFVAMKGRCGSYKFGRVEQVYKRGGSGRYWLLAVACIPLVNGNKIHSRIYLYSGNQ